ncbi:MAG TPA: hypothetical protein VM529_06660 [Gemmata sp.]|jgi:hypothetical protein|nr:hypothetical protein [Gemmata sp.]
MAAWLTVYCSTTVAHITPSDLLSLLRGLDDPWTLAEGFGIEDEAEVDRALVRLQIEPVPEPEGVKYVLRYRTRKLRPVYFHLWAKPGRVQAEREEALEQFEGARERNAGRVRKHMEKVIEVVALELGWNQLEDMGVVLAGQIAEFVATEGDGLIRDQNDDWWAMKNRVPVLLVGKRNRP